MQNPQSIIIVLLAIIATSLSTESYYTKIIHNTDTNAKCLDGSPPMVYLH